MATSYKQKKDKYEGMTLNSKPLTPYPPDTDSYDETETTEKLLEDYYEAKINHNYPNFHKIWEKVKEVRRVYAPA